MDEIHGFRVIPRFRRINQKHIQHHVENTIGNEENQNLTKLMEDDGKDKKLIIIIIMAVVIVVAIIIIIIIVVCKCRRSKGDEEEKEEKSKSKWRLDKEWDDRGDNGNSRA